MVALSHVLYLRAQVSCPMSYVYLLGINEKSLIQMNV